MKLLKEQSKLLIEKILLCSFITCSIIKNKSVSNLTQAKMLVQELIVVFVWAFFYVIGRYKCFREIIVKPIFNTKRQSRYADTKSTKKILYFSLWPLCLTWFYPLRLCGKYSLFRTIFLTAEAQRTQRWAFKVHNSIFLTGRREHYESSFSLNNGGDARVSQQ